MTNEGRDQEEKGKISGKRVGEKRRGKFLASKGMGALKKGECNVFFRGTSRFRICEREAQGRAASFQGRGRGLSGNDENTGKGGAPYQLQQNNPREKKEKGG